MSRDEARVERGEPRGRTAASDKHGSPNGRGSGALRRTIARRLTARTGAAASLAVGRRPTLAAGRTGAALPLCERGRSVGHDDGERDDNGDAHPVLLDGFPRQAARPPSTISSIDMADAPLAGTFLLNF
jgi:hypothetical protein